MNISSASTTENERAQLLLLSSYHHSARRILMALDGALDIRNSREPNDSPTNNTDIVGLCGQGGRHRYFRVPEVRLRTAALEVTVANNLDTVAAVCQGLRRSTAFNDGTGCANDEVPSIVPLLPPEEIWFDNREVPLDVWRLLSFDIDLVSSGLSAHVPLDDIAFGSLTQTGLAFRAIMSRIQAGQVELIISGRNLSVAFPSGLSSSDLTLSIPIARIFFEAGVLLTPLRQSDISPWYAALRYSEWIANTPPRFCVHDKYKRESVDSRYRGLFAEEIAIGIMAVVLGDVFGAKPIINTVEFLATQGTGAVPKNVLIADFVAKAKNNSTGEDWTIIAESKGSLGKLVSKGRIKHAKEQVSATKARFAGTAAKLPLALCSTVFFAKQGRGASCTVVDPPNETGPEDVILDPLDAWRAAYAKAFRFVGLDAASNQVLRREPITSLHRIDDADTAVHDDREQSVRRRRRARNAKDRLNADLLLDVGDSAIAIDPKILVMLREAGVSEGMAPQFEEIAETRRGQPSRGHSFLNYLGLGCVPYEDLDEMGG